MHVSKKNRLEDITILEGDFVTEHVTKEALFISSVLGVAENNIPTITQDPLRARVRMVVLRSVVYRAP